MSVEQWKEVSEWVGYEVSNLGRVRSWKHWGAGRKWHVCRDLEPRLLRPALRNGYLSVLFSEHGKGRQHQSVHVLVLEAFIGPRPDGYHGAHSNGDPTDNILGNLRWASPAENNADKYRHGTAQHGERCGGSKLTNDQAREICRRRAEGESNIGLSREFGVNRNTITNVTSGRYYSRETGGGC